MEAGKSIARSGFGVISSEKDQGWFGKGIYTSSSMKYAHGYANLKLSGANEPGMLVCAVIPGNIFPTNIIKNGRSLESGYQSHFAVGESFFFFLTWFSLFVSSVSLFP
jgi:hypothetical protein